MKSNIPITLLCSAFFILFAVHSILKHLNFQTQAFDLGIYTQTMWLYSQGKLAYSTYIHTYMITNHFEPFLIFLSPIYKVFSTPITLLTLQAIFVAASGFPLYKIVHHRLGNTYLALVIILTYFTSTAILFPINYDVHTDTLRTLPLAFMVYGWYFKKNMILWISIITALTLRDDMLLVMMGMTTLFLFEKKIKLAIYLFVFTIVSAYIIFQLIPQVIPKTESKYELNELVSNTVIPLNDPIAVFTNPASSIVKVFSPSEKFFTPLILIGEYLFLPLYSLLTFVITLPHILIRFLFNRDTIWQLYFQYNATVAPFLCIAAAFGYAKVQKYAISPILIIPTLLILSIFKYTTVIGTTTMHNIQNVATYLPLHQQLSLIQSEFPNQTVSTTFTIAPHLSNREKIYMYPETKDAELLIIHPNLPYNFDRQSQKLLIDHPNHLINKSEWQLLKTIGEFHIYQRIISS